MVRPEPHVPWLAVLAGKKIQLRHNVKHCVKPCQSTGLLEPPSPFVSQTLDWIFLLALHRLKGNYDHGMLQLTAQ